MTGPAPFECPDCGTRHNHELALKFCCNTDEDRQRGIYRGSD